MTPTDLLNNHRPIRVEKGFNVVWSLVGTYFDHIPEANSSWQYDITDKGQLDSLEEHIFGYIYHDHRRQHKLSAIRFKDEWVMIITNAGREGDDYSERYVLNAPTLNGLAAILRSGEESVEVNPDKDIPELTCFYGKNLEVHPK